VIERYWLLHDAKFLKGRGSRQGKKDDFELEKPQ